MAFIRNQYGNWVYVPDYRTGGTRIDSNSFPVRGIGLDTTQTTGPVNPQQVGFVPTFSQQITPDSGGSYPNIIGGPSDPNAPAGPLPNQFSVEPTPIPEMPGYGSGYVNIGGGFDPQASVGGTNIRDFIGGAGAFGYYGLPPSPSDAFAGVGGGGSTGGYGGGSPSVGGNMTLGSLPDFGYIPPYSDYGASPVDYGNPFAGVSGGGEAHPWDFTGTPAPPFSEPGALPGTEFTPSPAGFGDLVQPPPIPGVPDPSSGGAPSAPPIPVPAGFGQLVPPPPLPPVTGFTGGFGVGAGPGFGVTPGGFSTGYTPFGGGGVGPQFSPGGLGGGIGGTGGGGVFATGYMHGGFDPSSDSSPGPMDALTAGRVMPEGSRQPGDVLLHGIPTDQLPWSINQNSLAWWQSLSPAQRSWYSTSTPFRSQGYAIPRGPSPTTPYNPAAAIPGGGVSSFGSPGAGTSGGLMSGGSFPPPTPPIPQDPYTSNFLQDPYTQAYLAEFGPVLSDNTPKPIPSSRVVGAGR